MLSTSEIQKAYELAKARAIAWFDQHPEKENCGFSVLIAATATSKTIISNKGETAGREIVKARYAVIWRLMVEKTKDELKFYNRVQSDPFLTQEEDWVTKEKMLGWKTQNNQVRDELNKELAQALKNRDRAYFLELHEEISEWIASGSSSDAK